MSLTPVIPRGGVVIRHVFQATLVSMFTKRRLNRRRAVSPPQLLETRVLPAVLTVTTLADTYNPGDGETSLREALADANATTDADYIQFEDQLFSQGPQTITLQLGELFITNPVTIAGPESARLELDASLLHRVFIADDSDDTRLSDIQLSDLRLVRGAALGVGDAGSGGAVLSYEALTLRNVEIYFSSASWSGGAVAAMNREGATTSSSVSMLEGSRIFGNSAGEGGGVYGSPLNPLTGGQSWINISDSEILGNSAAHGGGGGVSGGAVSVFRSRIADNSAYFDPSSISSGQSGAGGGILASSLSIADTTLEFNSAARWGGAVAAYATSLSDNTVSISRSLFVQNESGFSGGAVFLAAGADIDNTTLVGNRVTTSIDSTAHSGGAVHTLGVLTILNSTIVRNHAYYGGGLRGEGAESRVYIFNSIIAGNTTTSTSFWQGGYLRSYDNIEGAVQPESANNIVGDPGFSGGASNLIVPDTILSDHSDWRQVLENDGIDPVLHANGGPTASIALRQGSIAIDAGDNSAVRFNHDQRGFGYDRVVAVTGSVATVDIGAVEKQFPGPRIHDAVASRSHFHAGWDRVADAISYEFSVYRIGEVGSFFDGATSELFFADSLAVPVGRYRFWIRGVLGGGELTPWSSRVFIVDDAPEAYTVWHHDGDARRLGFSWDEVSGAEGYRVYLYNATAEEVIADAIISENSFEMADPIEFGEYRFWVRVVANSGYQSIWSDVVQEYEGVVLGSPRGVGFTAPEVFRWTAADGVASVRIYVLHNNRVIIDESGVTGNEYAHSEPLPDGIYRWWVLPMDESGNAGRWSAPADFRSDGRTTLVRDPILERAEFWWLPVNGAADYELFVRDDSGSVFVYRSIVATSIRLPPQDFISATVWVRARTSDGEFGLWSRPERLVSSPEPTLPTPVADQLVRISAPGVVLVSWEEVPDAASYEIHIRVRDPRQLSRFVSEAILPRETHEFAIDASMLSEVQEVEWYVRAVGADPNAVSSWYQSVIYLDSRTVLVAPFGESDSDQPLFEWVSVDGFGSYELYVSREDNVVFRQIVQGVVGAHGHRTYRIPSSLSVGTYSYWLRAIGSSPAPWSLRGTFSIE